MEPRLQEVKETSVTRFISAESAERKNPIQKETIMMQKSVKMSGSLDSIYETDYKGHINYVAYYANTT